MSTDDEGDPERREAAPTREPLAGGTDSWNEPTWNLADEEDTGPEPVAHRDRRVCGNPPCREQLGKRTNEVEGRCPKCGTPFSFRPPMRRGHWLGRGESDERKTGYEVRRVLDVGGYGWIFLARDHAVGRHVVIKLAVDPGDPAGDAVAEAEGRELARVNHPGLPTVFTVLRRPHPTSGRPVDYIVMEYVAGKSLDQRHRDAATGTGPRLSLDELYDVFEQVLRALHHLHSTKRTYNDPSPHNIMITPGGRAVLVDFGAVTSMGTRLDTVPSKTAYRAPLEPADRLVDVGTDLYAVARSMIETCFALPAETFREPDSPALPSGETLGITVRNHALMLLVRRALGIRVDEEDTAPFNAEDMADQLSRIRRELASPLETTVGPSPRSLFATRPTPPPSLFDRREPGVHGSDHDGAPLDAIDLAAAMLALPRLRVDPLTPNRSVLEDLRLEKPARRIELLKRLCCPADPAGTTEEEATGLQHEPIVPMDERLEMAMAGLELNIPDTAKLSELECDALGDPRVSWLRGLRAVVVDRDHDAAREHFEAVLCHRPGEQAPKLALAHLARLDGNTSEALEYYTLAWNADRSLVSAAYGRAHALLAAGNHVDAAEALCEIPPDPRYRDRARRGAAVVLCRGLEAGTVESRQFHDRFAVLAWSEPLTFSQAAARVSILKVARRWLSAAPVAARAALPESLFDHPCDGIGLRRALSDALDAQAEVAPDRGTARVLRRGADEVRPLRLPAWLTRGRS